MRSTMALPWHNLDSWYMSLPSSAKQQREATKFCLDGEREPRRIKFIFGILRGVP